MLCIAAFCFSQLIDSTEYSFQEPNIFVSVGLNNFHIYCIYHLADALTPTVKGILLQLVTRISQ